MEERIMNTRFDLKERKKIGGIRKTVLIMSLAILFGTFGYRYLLIMQHRFLPKLEVMEEGDIYQL